MTKSKLRDLKKVYENSFPEDKKAWELLCESRNKVSWKAFYFMVLKIQKLTSEGSNYQLTHDQG